MNWKDPNSGELTKGFREMGFLPEAFVNMLAVLGWNDGSEQELFSLEELVEKFSMERIGKSGAKFDFEKAKWFNQEWIKRIDEQRLLALVSEQLALHGVRDADSHYVAQVTALIRDRLTFVTDFWPQASYFFQAPASYDLDAVAPRWNADKDAFFRQIGEQLAHFEPWHSAELESFYKLAIQASGMKMGELMLPLRIMLVGGKFGPHVFDIAALLGREETVERIRKGLEAFSG